MIPLDRWIHVRILTIHQVRLIVLLLGLSVLASMQETLFQGAFRCVGKFPFGTFAKSLLSLGSFTPSTTAVLFGARPTRWPSAINCQRHRHVYFVEPLKAKYSVD